MPFWLWKKDLAVYRKFSTVFKNIFCNFQAHDSFGVVALLQLARGQRQLLRCAWHVLSFRKRDVVSQLLLDAAHERERALWAAFPGDEQAEQARRVGQGRRSDGLGDDGVSDQGPRHLVGLGVDRVHLLPPSSGKLILLIYIYLYPRTVGRTMTKCLAKTGETLVSMNRDTVSQAYFALHETLHKVQNF